VVADKFEFEKEYRETVIVIKDIFEDVRFNRELHFNSIKNKAMKIVDTVQNSRNMMSLLSSVRNLDSYQYIHQIDVAVIAATIAKYLKLSPSDIYNITCTGLMHDIGKAKIPDSILNKSSELNNMELQKIRNHSKKGFELLADKNCFEGAVLLGILSHHERNDGSGYPFGFRGSEIHLYAKIIAIADVFSAMTSKRSYSTCVPILDVIREIANDSYGCLDQEVCKVFLKVIDDCFLGATVILSNDVIGEVVHINSETPSRLIVYSSDNYFDLSKQSDLEIVEIIFC